MKIRQARKLVRNVVSVKRWRSASPYWRERILDLEFHTGGTVFGDRRLCTAVFTVRRWLRRADEPKIKNLKKYGI